MPAGTGVITASDFSNFEPKLIAEAQYTLQHETLMPQLFRNEELTEHMGRTWNQPRHGTVLATGLVEGVPLAVGQVPAQSTTAITPGEAGAEVIITKVALQSGRDDYMKQMGVVLADSIKLKIDRDGFARFVDYTAIGTAGGSVQLNGGYINAAVSRVRSASNSTLGVPRGPFYLVHRYEPISYLLNTIAPTGTYPIPTGLSQEIIDLYYMHDLKVFSLNGGFASGNLPRVTPSSATTDALGAVFSKNATIYVEAQAAEFESQYDPELRGWLEVGVARYAYGVDVTSWGIGMPFLAADRTI